MDMVSPILDIASRLWNCTAGHASYVTDLEETVTSLKMKTEELIAMSNDVKSEVQLQEQQGMKRKEQVQVWLTRVENTNNEVNEILQQYEQLNGNTSTCLKKSHCWFAYKIGRKGANILAAVTDRINERRGFQEVVMQVQKPKQDPDRDPTRETKGLCEMPMKEPVGIEYSLENIEELLKDDNVGVIGLYGMGGVGKTTLMKKLNNKLTKSSGDDVFDVAFWVVASKSATVESIQQIIMEKLDIPHETWRNKSMDEKSAMVYASLEGKKYILMLDDVWEWLDLFERVGLPKPDNQNKSKIIFTTRSEDICSRMQAQKKIKVTCLPWDKAWTLFEEYAGGRDHIRSHPEIMGLAEKVAKECDGLPLALITIGRAMASKKTHSEWSHALRKLKDYPSKFLDVGKHVLPVLKFSYDNLADEITQKCFLYYSLFPQDYETKSEQLVDLWMGEGYLKDHDVREARNHGFSIIEDLKRACLLESGINVHTNKAWVKMHDVIRDMAIWITSNCGKHNKKFLIHEMSELTGDNIQGLNEDIEKMSMWNNEFLRENSFSNRNTVVEMFKNSITCSCPQLSTLVINLSTLQRSLGWGLSNFVPSLRVLDLSTRNYRSLISSQMLEGISELMNLEYLNLSGLAIERLPKECKFLSKLRYLLMNNMLGLRELPVEIIYGLTELLVFQMDSTPVGKKFIRGLDNSQKLQEISIKVTSIKSLEIYFKSEKLQKCTRFLELENMYMHEVKLSLTNMINLETLRISNTIFNITKCNPNLMGFKGLQNVAIRFCDIVEDLDFLTYAPSLEYLEVGNCESLQRISCVEDILAPVFSNLKELHLSYLPNLEMICNKPLNFSNLKNFEINECPKLQKNLFNDMIPTNTHLRMIVADQEWWNALKAE